MPLTPPPSRTRSEFTRCSQSHDPSPFDFGAPRLGTRIATNASTIPAIAQMITSGNRQSAGASGVETSKTIRPTDTADAEPIRNLGIFAPAVRLGGVTPASPP